MTRCWEYGLCYLLCISYFVQFLVAIESEETAYIFFQEGRHYQYTLNDHENALVAYENADAIMPNLHEVLFDFSGMYNDLGVLSMSLRSLESAELAFAKALMIAPKHIAALSNLAGIKYTMGDLDEANRLYDIAVNLPDASSELLYNYGVFL
jgi:tetratricopeptide (TPR) repeat protein